MIDRKRQQIKKETMQNISTMLQIQIFLGRHRQLKPNKTNTIIL